MGGWRTAGLVAVVVVVLAAGWAGAEEQVTVTLDPARRYQTVMGWGKTTPWLAASPLIRDECIDRAVNDLGLNRLRFEGECGNSIVRRSWEWDNDNADPLTINWAAFNTADLDARAANWLVPWKKAVEARGEEFDIYVSPSFFQGGSSGDLPPWMAADPEEYAEWALALLLRLRADGITADWYSICNEAGNNNVFTPQVVARTAKALMPRLAKEGLATRLQFPECVNAATSWRYVEALKDDADLWKWIGLISYHWYGRDNQASMVKLRDFARDRGLPTAQTEFMDLTIDHLYDDMVLGGVSYWEIYGLGTPAYKETMSHVDSGDVQRRPLVLALPPGFPLRAPRRGAHRCGVVRPGGALPRVRTVRPPDRAAHQYDRSRRRAERDRLETPRRRLRRKPRGGPRRLRRVGRSDRR